MFVKLSKNSFVRIYDNGELGYITNQLTRHDAMFTDAGVDFLAALTRYPQDELSLANSIWESKYPAADPRKIFADITYMMMILSEAKFVVRGEHPEELEDKDLSFCYSLGNPKLFAENFDNRFEQIGGYDSTEKFALEHDSHSPRITVIQFELTSKCNERCIHCYIPNGKKDTGINMPVSKVKSILDEFAAMNGLAVTLSGGEALMHNGLADILRYCRDKDLQITLLSNLVLLRDDLIPVLKETNVSLVQVSLYSMDRDIHDQITSRRGSFEKTVSAIKKLHKANVPVQIACPEMKANRHSYKDVMLFAQSLNMKSQTDFIMMARADLDKDNLANRLSIAETEELLRDIVDYDVDYKTMVKKLRPKSSDRESFLNGPMCGAGLNDICIAANGDVYPCAGWQSMVVGNVYRDTLNRIWHNSSKLNEIRKVTRKDFPQCIDCEARNYCAICMVRNYNENNGDMFKVSKHFCDVAFLNKRIAEEKLNLKS